MTCIKKQCKGRGVAFYDLSSGIPDPTVIKEFKQVAAHTFCVGNELKKIQFNDEFKALALTGVDDFDIHINILKNKGYYISYQS